MTPHIPVLKEEILSAFKETSLQIFFDGTLGAGGHAEALLMNHPEIKTYIGCDRDETALALAKKRLEPWKEKCLFVHGNFSDIDHLLKKENVKSLDGFLIDLGVSSMQLDQAERGFSFLREGPLDMRMDQSEDLTAAHIVNKWSEKELGFIIKEYGEERGWRKIAHALVETRAKKKFKTTKDLAECIEKLSNGKRGRLHPATLTFQALRMRVNDELSHVEKALKKVLFYLSPHGRAAVISFHRLEDRVVKNAFKGTGFHLVFKKPLIPTLAEIKKNPRSRSAKLRVAEKDE